MNLPLMQDKVIALLEENGFKFVEKKGIKLSFETPTDDVATDARTAKDLVKGSDFGAALYFNVEVA
jgi:predicted RNA binding protein YcfA (HicA-like mRNA interferase family)